MKNDRVKIRRKSSDGGRKIWRAVLPAVYGAALAVCLICDLATDGGLSWFWIVLCSLMLAFSVFHLPFLLKKHRLLPAALAATLSLWLLLAACEAVTGGGWLRPYGLPIAAYPLAFVWAMLLVTRLRGLNWFFRSALLSLLAGALTLTMNAWVGAVLAGGPGRFAEFFFSQFSPCGTGSFVNALAAACFFLYFVLGTALGAAAAVRARSGQRP